jgi:hypothetical protein
VQADTTVTREVTAIPTVAGATPALFRGHSRAGAKRKAPPKVEKALGDDDIMIIEPVCGTWQMHTNGIGRFVC